MHSARDTWEYFGMTGNAWTIGGYWGMDLEFLGMTFGTVVDLRAGSLEREILP